MIRKIFPIVAALLAVLLIVVALQPSAFRVTRSISIQADAASVYGLVNDFHEWKQWSPWAKIDPAMKEEFSGAPRGAGAVYYWNGNSDAGEGRMTIEESDAPRHVGLKLEFIRPFPSTNRMDFAFQGNGPTTNVEWVMTGEADYVSKLFLFFMGGMDKAVGPDFEKGLAQMKAAAEKPR